MVAKKTAVPLVVELWYDVLESGGYRLDMDRRKFMMTGAGCVIALTVCRRLAFAQTTSFEEVVENNRQLSASYLANVVTAPVPLTPDRVMAFVLRDLILRLYFATVFDSLEGTADPFVLQDMSKVAEIITEQGLPLIPSSYFIRPDAPPILPPYAPDQAKEPVNIIVIDILLEWLDIGISRDLLLRAAEQSPEFEDALKRLAGSITTRDWQTFANDLERIFAIIFTGELFFALREELGEETVSRLRRKLAFKTVLKFVPIVGWAYMAASLMLAIKNNFHRF